MSFNKREGKQTMLGACRTPIAVARQKQHPCLSWAV